VIIDSHAHTFPPLRYAPGFDRPTEFLALMQRGLAFHGQPTRRVRDNAIVTDLPPIWDPDDLGLGGGREVDFRVGRHGRFVWTIDGEDYYKQYLPAWLVENESAPDLIAATMDQADIDMAVLQNDGYYGKLNDYFAACVRQHPGRFIGTAHIDEDSADSDTSLAELERCATVLGLRGLFVSSLQYWLRGFHLRVDDDRLRAFWAAVERLGLVVYWSIGSGPSRDEAGYLDELSRIGRVLDRHPAIRSVVVGGMPNRYLDQPEASLPAPLAALTERDAICFELVFPISMGRVEEYPFPTAQAAVRRLYDRLGARKLVWGSDMPNVERHCTYGQSLTYLSRHCTFIPPDDMALILGGNLMRLFDLS
jgi:predicted TIM-barrel fold metal-dependent hydrolase